MAGGRARALMGAAAAASLLAGFLVGTGYALSGHVPWDTSRQGRLPAPDAAATCLPAWSTITSPNPSTSVNFLSGVSALTDKDVWAVGHQLGTNKLYQTVSEHWDGASWTIKTTPNVGTSDNVLTSVAAVASNDVWAVGYYSTAGGVWQTLAMHWTGASWSVVSSPNIGTGNNFLFAVSAAASNDVWAVGHATGLNGVEQTLAMHWTGSAWRVVATPNPGGASSFLNGLAARPGDAWAVGYTASDTANALQTLILHWNGTAWTQTASPNAGSASNNFLAAAAALSSNDAWAVGYRDGVTQQLGLAMHWNGASWSVISNPANAPVDLRVLGVAPAASGDVWFVGTSTYSPVPVIEHWNGSVLSVVGASSVIAKGGLFGTSALSQGKAWSVGFTQTQGMNTLVEQLCPVSVTDSGFSPATSTVSFGSSVAWTFPSTNHNNHTVTDSSGMGLFDSGSKAPGSSYVVTLTGAGSYSVVDSLSAKTSTIKVTMTASPSTGRLTTTFTITWASVAPPAGYVEDIQIRRPGSTSYVDWRINQTTTTASFLPDGGTGTYSFRARLRNTANGKTSRWSPIASITVNP